MPETTEPAEPIFSIFSIAPSGADDPVSVDSVPDKAPEGGEPAFYFTIEREQAGSYLRFRAGAEGGGFPDFRRYSGALREALRLFAARKAQDSRAVRFHGARPQEDCIVNPEDLLIRRALDAGILRDIRGKALSYAGGGLHCAVLAQDLSLTGGYGGYVEISLILRDEAGAAAAKGGYPEYSRAGTAGGEGAGGGLPTFYTVSRGLAVTGDLVYAVPDLGPRWPETDRINAKAPQKDAALFLSRIFSAFTNLRLAYPRGTVKAGGPFKAVPGLFFIKRDSQGCLHVRPLYFLRGFPPLFLEDEKIITAVSLDHARQTAVIGEVVFPDSPQDLFREALQRGGGGDRAKPLFYEEQGRFIIPPQLAKLFFAAHIAELSRSFALIHTKALAGSRLCFPKPRLRLSLGRGIDYFSGGAAEAEAAAAVEVEGERFPAGAFLEEYRKSGWVTLCDGRKAVPDPEVMAKLAHFERFITGETMMLSYYAVPALLSDGDVILEGEGWARQGPFGRFFDFLSGYNRIPQREREFSLGRGSLRPYQEYGARWLDYLLEYRMGGCLADEMGLGKTVQVIALFRSLHRAGAQGKCLVICPKTLVFNWLAELDKFAPELPKTVYYGAGRDLSRLAGPPPRLPPQPEAVSTAHGDSITHPHDAGSLSRGFGGTGSPKSLTSASEGQRSCLHNPHPHDAGEPPHDAGEPPHDAGEPPHDAGMSPHDAGDSLYGAEDAAGGFEVVISTYGTIRRDAALLKDLAFLSVILDESQNIKNLSSQTAGAVFSLSSLHRAAMSGTPIENNLMELYSLFRFLNPHFFGSEADFTRQYLSPIQEKNDAAALKDLRSRIYPFMLRRRKDEVLAELPPKTEETVRIELDEAHRACYHQRRQEYKDRIRGIITGGRYAREGFTILAALSGLRRLASVPEKDGGEEPSAKRQYLRERAAELAAGGRKCLIFTNFLSAADLIRGDLEALGVPALVMTGATGNRASLVRRFQEDPAIKAFVITLKTGGCGLNLTAADYVFIFDPWWNTAAEQQALGRAHRIGQVNPVFCYRLIAKDTIEERIEELQKRKSGLSSALILSDQALLKALTPDDTLFLLGSAGGGAYGT
jgi:superfamily II DNA or RNA helicase